MKKKTYLSLLALAIVSLAYASINDLAISNHYYGKLPRFGKLFEVIGGSPAYLLIAICGASLAYLKESRLLSTCLYGGSLISFSLFFKDMVGYAISPGGTDSKASVSLDVKLISLGLAIVCFVPLYRFLHRFGKAKLRKHQREFLLVLLACLLQLFVQEMTKIIFARPRYWTIVDGTYQFQAWYQASGPMLDNARMSFYSGHTANAYMSIFGACFTNNKLYQRFAFTFGLVFGTCTAISRIVMGQHFLSDVTMSFIVVITLFYVVSNYLKKQA